MRVACVQADAAYGKPDANLYRIEDGIREAKASGADLAVFPEAFLTGYCAESRDEALAIALPDTSSHLASVKRLSEEHDIVVAVGFAENDEGQLHNTVAFVEPGKRLRIYRKTHLPILGFDRFAKPGHELPVFDTRIGKVGIMICFDQRIPEVARTLALKGAELILVPTNWPEGAETSADHFSITRAAENRVFLAACNRIGTEKGFRFIGRSKIVEPTGKVLAAAGDGEETIVADLDLSIARQKRTVVIPGAYETEIFATRQPDLYRPIVDLYQPNEPVGR